LKKRLITYMRSGKDKLWLSSTPTIESGPIWQALTTEAQVVFDYCAACPECHTEQVMSFGQIKWGESRDPEQIEHEKLARYECSACGAAWDDDRRDAAVRAGCWRARLATPETAAALALAPHTAEHGEELYEYLRKYNPAKIGFHLPSKISPFVSLSQDAAAFLRGQKDKAKLRDWRNAHEALPWVYYEHARKEDTMLALRDDRPQGLVPSGGVVAALTAGIDTQDNGFWFEVRAWGFGLAMDSWQVRFGFVDSFAALDEILWGSSYVDADGNTYAIKRALIDSGGHRTSAVYDFCRLHPRQIWPSKGEGRMAAVMHKTSKIDTYPGTSRLIPGGIHLVLVSANQYKDQLAGKLAVAATEPGAWRLCSDCTDDWARQMTAEVIDPKTGLWINPPGRANHAWDCSVLNLVAADLKPEIRFWRRDFSDPAPAPEAPKIITPIQHAAAQRQAMMRRRPSGSWMGGI
jgi:terminase, large subunit